MPVFEVERNGEVFEVEGPDEASVFGALGNTGQQSPQEGDPSVYKQGPVEPPTDPRESLGAGFGSMIPGLSQGSGAINYMLQGGAPGSYDQGVQQFDQRMGRAESDNPGWFMGGQGLSLAVPMSGAAKAVPRAAEYGLRAGGLATRYGGTASALMHGNLPGAYAAWEGGGKMRAMGQAMKANRMARGESKLADAMKGGKWQGSGDPLRGPAPNARMNQLSPEMQAQSDAYQAFLRRHGR